MMRMQGINQTEILGLEVLTPTQTGSGQELFKEIDYIDRGGEAFIVDQPQTFNAIACGDAELDQHLAQTSQLSDWVSMAGQDFGYRLSWFSNKNKLPEKFREQLKDAMNRPYIPGSAIKGAIRTACIAETLRAKWKDEYDKLMPSKFGKKPSPKWASADLINALIGKDAKQDLFRAFKVRDALFTGESLRLTDIRWLNEKRWRSMSKKKSFDDWKQADGIIAEVLQPQAVAEFSLQWDGFLQSDSGWQQSKVNSGLLPENWENLKRTLNRHARFRLNHEIEFYKNQGKLQPQQECERLLAMIDDQAAYLQLSWGSGWRGMTGDWLKEERLQNMRNLYNLGKTGKPFPKTRRLAVSGEPKLPLGWVRLVPISQIADQIEQQRQQQQEQNSRCAWVDQQIARVIKENRCSEQEALRGKALANAWKELVDGGNKEEALADIRSRWQDQGWWDEPNGRAAKQARKIYGE